jgi:DNA-binding transcriptional LysR family regulator
MSAIDLNLLRIFDALMEEQNVTRAGDRLGLSQSAVSHALTRLRTHFGDPLFVRRPNGMAPTARALEIGPGVHAALAQLQTAVLPPRFEPAAARTRFNIATGAYGCAVLAPPLLRRLGEAAPGIDLAMIQPGGDATELLDNRRADFGIWMDEPVPERVSATPLLSEDMVWAVRPGHPILARPATLEALAGVRHAIVTTRRAPSVGRAMTPAEGLWEGMRPFQEALAAQGLKQRVALRVHDVYSAMTAAAQSDLATLIPRRLARLAERSGALSLIEPPHPTIAFHMSLTVLRDRLNEPALAWMHRLLVGVAGEV